MSSSNTHTIFLVLRTGGDFTFPDVELLANYLQKYWVSEEPLIIYCLFDRVTEKYELKNLTILPMPNKQWKGWWSKMNLFSPELESYRPFLYLDLDTAVLGNIRPLFDRKDGEFIGLEDFFHKGKFASGVMWIPANSSKIKDLWDRWIFSPEKHIKAYRGDQNFISNFIRSNTYWQMVTDMICSFKVRGRDRSWLREVPENIRVVCFHGRPRPIEASHTVKWVRDYVTESL